MTSEWHPERRNNVPSPEEAAAITAALAAFGGRRTSEPSPLQREGWRLSGLPGGALSQDLDGSPWSYSNWNGMV